METIIAATVLESIGKRLYNLFEDVLTRIMYGEHVDDTFLPCGYVPRYKEGQDAA